MSEPQTITRVPPEKNRGGVWITFGEEEYRVPALSFGKIQELQDRIAAMSAVSPGGQPTASQMDTVLDVVHAAMVRNYPALKRDEVADMIDLENYQEVLGAVLRIAGFKQREAGGASGEALASTGTPSTSA